MTVKAILYKYRTKDGTHPIYLRITEKKKCSYISLKVWLRANQWDEKQGLAKSNYPAAPELNELILKKSVAIRKTSHVLQSQDTDMTSDKIKKEQKRNSMSADLLEYAKEHIKKYDNPNTFSRVVTHLNKLIRFLKHTNRPYKQIPFNMLDADLLTEYQHYLKEKIGNGINCRHQTLKTLRTLFNGAIKKKIISRDIYPFADVEMPTEDSIKIPLTPEEIMMIAHAENLVPYEMISRDIFLLSYLFGGIRASDTITLKWSDFDSNLTMLKRKSMKTGKIINIEVEPDAQTILKKYYVNGNEFVFHFITDESKIHRQISSATCVVNKGLKNIAKKIGLQKKTTSHLSRHSWCMNAIINGADVVEVSQTLQHSSLKTTQAYIATFNATQKSKTNRKAMTGIKIFS